MKYNININQKALSELSDDMDVLDASILVYINDICGSGSEKIHSRRFKDENGIFWTWVDLQTLCDDMPLLRIGSRSAISNRIKRIEKNGFISTLIRMVDRHSRLFIKLNDKVDNLTFVEKNVSVVDTFSKTNVSRGDTFCLENEHVLLEERVEDSHVLQNARIIDTSNTIHNNTTYSVQKGRTRKKDIPMDSDRLSLFNDFWAAFPIKKGKQLAEARWKEIDIAIMPMIIEDVKKKSIKDDQWIRGYAPHPPTYLNQKRWTDEIDPPKTTAPKLAPGNTYTKGKMKDVEELIV